MTADELRQLKTGQEVRTPGGVGQAYEIVLTQQGERLLRVTHKVQVMVEKQSRTRTIWREYRAEEVICNSVS
jgi:hypothetical protein